MHLYERYVSQMILNYFTEMWLLLNSNFPAVPVEIIEKSKLYIPSSPGSWVFWIKIG